MCVVTGMIAITETISTKETIPEYTLCKPNTFLDDLRLLLITVLVRHLKAGEIHCHLSMSDHSCSDSFFPLPQGLPCRNITINVYFQILYIWWTLLHTKWCLNTFVWEISMFLLIRSFYTLSALLPHLYIYPLKYSELTPFFYIHGSIESELEEAYIKTRNVWDILPGSFERIFSGNWDFLYFLSFSILLFTLK